MTEPVRPRLVKSILTNSIFLIYASYEGHEGYYGSDQEWAVCVKPGEQASYHIGQKMHGNWSTYPLYKGKVKDFLD